MSNINQPGNAKGDSMTKKTRSQIEKDIRSTLRMALRDWDNATPGQRFEALRAAAAMAEKDCYGIRWERQADNPDEQGTQTSIG